MPPMLSDEESIHSASSDNDIIPNKKKTPIKPADEVDDDEEDEEDEEGEEYVVEKIISHGFEEDGSIKYEVKWQGYESKADRTWEPKENLATAPEALEEYHRKIGGEPVFQQKGKKRKQSMGASAANTSYEKGGRGRKKTKPSPDTNATPEISTKKDVNWMPMGTWEQDVERVDTVEEKPDPKTGELVRWAYLVWINGKKTKHPLKQVNMKCPQKMLQYYEQHLVFKNGSDDEIKDEMNGDL